MGKHTSKGSASKKSDSDSPPEVIVGSGTGKMRRPAFVKRAYVTCAVLVAVVVIAALVIFVSTRHRLPNNISAVCTNDIAAEASKYQTLGDAGSLSQLMYKIQKKQFYQNDPNCIYIRTEQLLLSSDVNSAKKTIDDLEKTYGKNYRFNTKLDNGKASINNLRDQLRTTQNVEQNAKARFDPDI